MTVKNREIEIRTVNVTRYIMPLREGGRSPEDVGRSGGGLQENRLLQCRDVGVHDG